MDQRFLSILRRLPVVLAGNPFHVDATEITRIAGVDFTLNVTIDTQRRLNGELETAHLAGAEFTEKQAKATVSKPADAVLASCVNRPLELLLPGR